MPRWSVGTIWQRCPGSGAGRRRRNRRRTGTLLCLPHSSRRSAQTTAAASRLTAHPPRQPGWPSTRMRTLGEIPAMAPSGVISDTGITINDFLGADTPGTRQAERRLAQLERCAVMRPNNTRGLWHAELHHGSRRVLTANGRWVTPVLLGIIDDHPGWSVVSAVVSGRDGLRHWWHLPARRCRNEGLPQSADDR